MIRIEAEAPVEAGARENLLDLAFGRRRSAKTSQRLRNDRLPADGLAYSAKNASGRVVGTIRLWHISAGAKRPALLLGPLAVHPSFRRKGIGSALVREALAKAKALGHAAVLLVGDEPFYRRFGFCRALTEQLRLPGPFDRDRFLGLELAPGALTDARGVVTATGATVPAIAPALPTAALRRLTPRARRAS
jgi:predicted N-acetyltransferase YhbS